MPNPEWKDVMKGLIEASYERTLRDIPKSFAGLSKQEIKTHRRMLKIVKRSAVLDIGFGTAVVVGNAAAAVLWNAGVAASAYAGAVLVRKGGHALIEAGLQR